MAATKTSAGKAGTARKRAAKKGVPPERAAKKNASAAKGAATKSPKGAPAAKKVSKGKAAAKGAAPAAKKSTPAAKKSTPTIKKSAPAVKKSAPVVKKSEAAAKKNASAAKKNAAAAVPDFAAFPPGAVTSHTTTLCLACIFSLFTKQLGLAPRTAYTEIRRYSPTVAELTAREPQRPFFAPADEKHPRCPYCDAAKRWHARLTLYRVEGGKANDAARRALVKALPAKDEEFVVTEEGRTARALFFEWLERLGQGLDFEDEAAWTARAARAYLERREPKVDWAAAFDGATRVRRSQRVEEGFERDGARLFLAPALYNDVLLVQYLVSRSHRHGGRTFEGRLTLPDLVRRMRAGVPSPAEDDAPADRFDALERHVERLAGGDRPVRLHFILDRRDLLDQTREVYARQG